MLIELKHVQKVVDGRTLIDIDALAVDAGEIVAIVGAPGSGKSVLLELLIGQTLPTAGPVQVAGLKPAKGSLQLSERIGVLFAENTLYRRMSVQAHLEFFCRLRGLPLARAEEVSAQVGLNDQLNVAANRLSKALARRLAFGLAILNRPSVVLLCEPFADADAASAALLTDLIETLADGGTALLILSSSTTRLVGLCDQIYQLDHGRLMEQESAAPSQPDERPFKVPARLEGKIALLNPSDILYISIEDGRTQLHTNEGDVPSHLTLGELEQRLERRGFFRAHRAYLVNLQHVKEVISFTRNSFSLVLDDPAASRIPLSKSSARDLRELLGY